LKIYSYCTDIEYHPVADTAYGTWDNWYDIFLTT